MRHSRWFTFCILRDCWGAAQLFVLSGYLAASLYCPPFLQGSKAPAQVSSRVTPATVRWGPQLSSDGEPRRRDGTQVTEGPFVHFPAGIPVTSTQALPFFWRGAAHRRPGHQTAPIQVNHLESTLPSGTFASAATPDNPLRSFTSRGNSPSNGNIFPCGTSSSTEAARLRLRFELPPVPAYPESGKIPEDIGQWYLYLDRDTGELVIVTRYFGHLEPGEERQGNWVTERAPLAIDTCPSLSAAIYEPGDGSGRGYAYRYRLRNRRQARRGVWGWQLPVFEGRGFSVSDLVHPYGWGSEYWEKTNVHAKLESHKYEALMKLFGYGSRHYRSRSRISRRRVNWFAKFHVLEPGKTLEPFGFTSEGKPGIVRVYVQGLGTYIPSRSTWPEELERLLHVFRPIQNNSLSISTIGPKFSPKADKTWMASDFLNSIEDLVQQGELAGESAFIREILPLLKMVARGQASGEDPGFWQAEPGTAFEAEMLSAIRLSLGAR